MEKWRTPAAPRVWLCRRAFGGALGIPERDRGWPAEADARYLAQIEDLSSALKGAGKMRQLADAFRALVETVTVRPVPARAPLDLEVRGYLAALTQAQLPPNARLCGLSMVAEEGLEPPTRGL